MGIYSGYLGAPDECMDISRDLRVPQIPKTENQATSRDIRDDMSVNYDVIHNIHSMLKSCTTQTTIEK